VTTSKATVRLVERVEYEALLQRCIAAGMNCDGRKVDVSVARPYVIQISGEHDESFSLPTLWEDIPSIEVVSLEET